MRYLQPSNRRTLATRSSGVVLERRTARMIADRSREGRAGSPETLDKTHPPS